MADNKEALPVLGWLIKHSYLGPHTVWCGHNSVADYRDADPGATSTELTSLPAATAALSEIHAEANRLSAMLDHRNDEAAETERMLRAEMQQMALRSLSAEGEWIDLTGELRAEVERLRVDAERYRWLRGCSYVRSDRGGVVVNWPKRINGKLIDGDRTLATEALDAAIDAARSAASGESAEGGV